MALNLTPRELQNLQALQYIQRLHRAQQIQQSAANNGGAARGAQPRQRGRHAAAAPGGGDATRRMLEEAGRANRQNRQAFKTWYRHHSQNMRARLARDSARMSGEVRRYGVSRPEWMIMVSSRDELQRLVQGLQDAQKLALFELAVARQAERGDITGDKVAVFNTISGRQGDMPLGVA